MIEIIRKNIVATAIIIALVFTVVALVGSNKSAGLGAAGDINTRFVSFVQGLKAGTTNQLVIDKSGVVTSDLSVSGGTVTLTTANTATSTATIGCVQTYATSTATSVRLVIGSIATSSTSYGGTNTIGLVGWQYGACPNL